ncbi:Branched-chain-amino-acid aminotransferase [Phytophthora megakarya]|uniref:Branched-chain-amino-acid aminotransferase n=1 Tax=Phytophthora megakarya TaxID=4795 RepID=A0A225V7Y7_9STRA|nr:Branched-chain-amino-acid aminotransferase [Phytophthora megakarya]
MSPVSTVLHYSAECFDGMKAYVDGKGHSRLFRPDMNLKRLNSSIRRLLLLGIVGDELTKCLADLIRLDRDGIPKGNGYSLYVRPTGISTQASIGVGASKQAKPFIILSPVGPYYPDSFNPVKLCVNDRYIRATSRGTGRYKIGPTALLVFSPKLVYPPLSRGDILADITRDSTLHLTCEWKEFKVTEDNITMKQVQKARKEGRPIEVFGSGTAAVVSPVATIHYMNEDLAISLDGTDGKAGKLVPCPRLAA